MLRGVNRQIIEVSETKNEYFERAILFVRPEYISKNESDLRSEADKTVSGLLLGSVRLRGSAPDGKRRYRKDALIVLALSCLTGALFAGAIFTAITLLF